jgi:glycosyltransferase involved in cell wall biosynthesis
MSNLPAYVLITPARNEEDYIELTIRSVIAQTARPLKWVIVSDGSSDRTDEIVERFAAHHPWIVLLRTPPRAARNFAGKVRAFGLGYESVQSLPFEVIGSVDADISFGREYLSVLLQRLSADPLLGLVGTPFTERSLPVYDYRFVSTEHVSGACQLFRRRCFEDIGGYVPVNGGGIDHIAVITARMKGWKTRTFTDISCEHHRVIGTAQHNKLAAKFRVGLQDHALGSHPLWEAFRTLYQMSKAPLLLGGAMVAAGYTWALVSQRERAVSEELVSFRRREQMARLRQFLLASTRPSVHPRTSG